MEAQAGIEPAHRGFADPSVSTSPLRHKYFPFYPSILTKTQLIFYHLRDNLPMYIPV